MHQYIKACIAERTPGLWAGFAPLTNATQAAQHEAVKNLMETFCRIWFGSISLPEAVPTSLNFGWVLQMV